MYPEIKFNVTIGGQCVKEYILPDQQINGIKLAALSMNPSNPQSVIELLLTTIGQVGDNWLSMEPIKRRELVTNAVMDGVPDNQITSTVATQMQELYDKVSLIPSTS